MGRSAAPLIVSIAECVEAYADGRSARDEEVPRFVGACQSTLHGATIERGASVHTLWMLQRTLDLYTGLDAAERGRVDSALAGTGWAAVLAYAPRHRLAKRGFELVFD